MDDRADCSRLRRPWRPAARPSPRSIPLAAPLHDGVDQRDRRMLRHLRLPLGIGLGGLVTEGKRMPVIGHGGRHALLLFAHVAQPHAERAGVEPLAPVGGAVGILVLQRPYFVGAPSVGETDSPLTELFLVKGAGPVPSPFPTSSVCIR
jgi:hypothetical protein